MTTTPRIETMEDMQTVVVSDINAELVKRLRTVEGERDELQECCRDIVARADRHKAERDHRDWQAPIARFNAGIGVARGTVGEWPSSDDLNLAWSLIQEEHDELTDALDAENLPEVIDAIADSIVVLVGLAHRLGVDLHPVMAEVARANLDKLGGPKRADGKQLKPEGWRPPDIGGVLRDQGWVW